MDCTDWLILRRYKGRGIVNIIIGVYIYTCIQGGVVDALRQYNGTQATYIACSLLRGCASYHVTGKLCMLISNASNAA